MNTGNDDSETQKDEITMFHSDHVLHRIKKQQFKLWYVGSGPTHASIDTFFTTYTASVDWPNSKHIKAFEIQ